jgi:hypothetical protein
VSHLITAGTIYSSKYQSCNYGINFSSGSVMKTCSTSAMENLFYYLTGSLSKMAAEDLLQENEDPVKTCVNSGDIVTC